MTNERVARRAGSRRDCREIGGGQTKGRTRFVPFALGAVAVLICHASGGNAAAPPRTTCSFHDDFPDGSRQIRRVEVSSLAGSIDLKISMHEGDGDADADDDHPRERLSFAIKIGGVRFLNAETVRAPSYVSTHLQFGRSFSGIHEETFVANGATATGMIDGRRFTSNADGGLVFADGKPAPTLQVDPIAQHDAETLLAQARDALSGCMTEPSTDTQHQPPGPPRIKLLPLFCDACELDCSDKYAKCLVEPPPACVPDSQPPCTGTPDPNVWKIACANTLQSCTRACTTGCYECCTNGTECHPEDHLCHRLPTPPPRKTLEILQYGQLSFGVNLPAPYNAGLGVDELVYVPQLGLTNAAHEAPMTVFFNPAPGSAFFASQAEALFFARDPEEVFRTLSSLDNDDAAWQLNTTGCAGAGCPLLPAIPAALALASPTQGGVLPATAIAAQGSFWGASPQGPGADPRGLSSIKAARVYQHGVCSIESPIVDILKRINGGILDSVFDPAGDLCSSHFNGNVKYTNLTSYLSHAEGAPSDLRGGFLFASDVSIFDTTGFLSPCNINFNIAYQFGLFDGRFWVTGLDTNFFNENGQPFPGNNPEGNGAVCEAFGLGGVRSGIGKAVLGTIPETIDGTADFLQMFPPDPNDTMFDGCESDPNKDPNPCAKFATDAGTSASFQLKIRAGAALGGLLGPEADAVIATMQRTDGAGRLVNWRCVNRPVRVQSSQSNTICLEDRNRCEYILRAKRLNVLPDVVELVWFDDAKEFDAPAIPIYYLSLAAGPTSPLCSRRPLAADPSLLNPSDSVVFNRAFANVHSFGHSGCDNVVTPPPPPQKCCSGDTDCAHGHVCVAGFSCSP